MVALQENAGIDRKQRLEPLMKSECCPKVSFCPSHGLILETCRNFLDESKKYILQQQKQRHPEQCEELNAVLALSTLLVAKSCYLLELMPRPWSGKKYGGRNSRNMPNTLKPKMLKRCLAAVHSKSMMRRPLSVCSLGQRLLQVLRRSFLPSYSICFCLPRR